MQSPFPNTHESRHWVPQRHVERVPDAPSSPSSGETIPVSQVSSVLHFEGRQWVERTVAGLHLERELGAELLGPAVKSPSLLTAFSPSAVVLGFLISQEA